MSDLFFSAEQSFDLDGGSVSCVFSVEYEVGDDLQWQTIETSDCYTNLSWIDDGIFEVIVTVIDEEQDSASSSVNVTVLNRPATVIISSIITETPALSMVTMEVFANDTDSEDDWPGLVDIYWPSANCLEGYFTRTCTTTADVEGLKSFTAIGTDDDGELTPAIWNITFTNAIPRDVNVTLWDVNGQGIESDQQGTFQVVEDEVMWLRAEALDSLDDLSTLEWRWRPDDQDTTWFVRTEGDSTAIEVAWPRSGRNIVRLEVVDNDGASSGFIETWVQVENVPPHIDELPDSSQISERETVSQTTPLGAKDMHLELKAETVTLSYRKELNLFALAVYVAESSDEDDAPDLYLTAEASVMEAMADGALEVCAAGRPLCSLCNAPIGEESHICPKQNGYARFGI